MAAGGVPLETIAALFILPLIATLVALARQVVGLKGFNIFTPLMIAFVFHEAGLEYGLTIFVLVLLASLLARFLLKKVRLQYLPRMALVITTVTLAVFAAFFLAMFFGRYGFISISLLPVLVLVALAEQFTAVYIEHGNKLAFALTVETFLVALTGFGLLAWPWLNNAVLAYPVPYTLTLVLINVFLGRWTGLRLLEAWRFRSLLKKRQDL